MCDQPPESCPGWNPGRFVSRTSTTEVEIDEGFVAGLIRSPDDLGSCDDGVIASAGSVFEVQGTSPGEFLYEIGLRNGDQIVSVNGLPLQSYSDAVVAYHDLYVAGATSYSLTVDRAGTTTTLWLELVP